MAEDNWKLPLISKDSNILLTVDELLLVDWLLCPASQLIPGLTVDDAVSLWHDIRAVSYTHLTLPTTPYV